jgi:hypothetical protein
MLDEPSYDVMSTFVIAVTPRDPVVRHDCDLLLYIHNPTDARVAAALVVGFETVQLYDLAPGETLAVVDGGPLPLVALAYRVVKIVCDSELSVTCGLCCNEDRRKLVECRLGRWTYRGSTMVESPAGVSRR